MGVGWGGGGRDVRYVVKASTEGESRQRKAAASLTSSSHAAPPQLRLRPCLRHFLFQGPFGGNQKQHQSVCWPSGFPGALLALQTQTSRNASVTADFGSSFRGDASEML